MNLLYSRRLDGFSFLLWVGLSRSAIRSDFFVGMPLAYGTAWILLISPAHLIQKLKDKTRTETPIGTPHRMQSRDKECLLSFIDISRPTSETLAIIAKFRNESDTNEFTTATTIQKLDERQEKTPNTTVQNVWDV